MLLRNWNQQQIWNSNRWHIRSSVYKCKITLCRVLPSAHYLIYESSIVFLQVIRCLHPNRCYNAPLSFIVFSPSLSVPLDRRLACIYSLRFFIALSTPVFLTRFCPHILGFLSFSFRIPSWYNHIYVVFQFKLYLLILKNPNFLAPHTSLVTIRGSSDFISDESPLNDGTDHKGFYLGP